MLEEYLDEATESLIARAKKIQPKIIHSASNFAPLGWVRIEISTISLIFDQKSPVCCYHRNSKDQWTTKHVDSVFDLDQIGSYRIGGAGRNSGSLQK